MCKVQLGVYKNLKNECFSQNIGTSKKAVISIIYIPFNKVKNLSLQFYYRINTVKHVT